MRFISFIPLLSIGVFVASMALGALNLRPLEEESVGGPIEVVGKSVIDIGDVPHFGTTNFSYRLRNNSEEPIRVVGCFSTCPCISSTASTNMIPAKGEMEVHARLILAKVNGQFTRFVYVRFESPEAGLKKLSVTGRVFELFENVPDKVVEINGMSTGEAVTNLVNFSTLRAGVSVGSPQVDAPENVKVSCSVVSNVIGDVINYSVSTVFTATEVRRRAMVMISLPVHGVPPPVNPVSLHYRIHGGSNLLALPDKITLDPAATVEQTFRVTVRSRDMSIREAELKWEPPPEGISISGLQVGRRKTGVVLDIKVTADAAKTLFADGKKPTIKLSYPNCGETEIAIEALPPAVGE